MILPGLLSLLLLTTATDSCSLDFYLRQYSDSVIRKCNTAGQATALSQTEKEVVLLTNLVRANPSFFLSNVARPFIETCYLKYIEYDPGSGHIESLYKDLEAAKPMQLLLTEPVLNETAASHAGYCSRTGHIGHHNFKVRWQIIKTKLGHLKAGENCSYVPARFSHALYYIISLLIDQDSPETHGHRMAILDKSYQYIGVAIRPFPQNRNVLIQNFSLKSYRSK